MILPFSCSALTDLEKSTCQTFYEITKNALVGPKQKRQHTFYRSRAYFSERFHFGFSLEKKMNDTLINK